MKSIKPVYFVSAILVMLSVSIAIPTLADSAQNKTLENLLTAYNGESNANAKYLAYAEKADEEGYAKVASLFRAAASAEKIHITNHAKWKAPKTDFYVCPICGYTLEGKPSFAACPVCNTPATLYQAVN